MKEVFVKASSGDFSKIADLYIKAILHLRSKNIDQWDALYPNREIIKADIRKHHMYVLRLDDEIISAVVLSRQQHELYNAVTWTHGKFAVIHRLCVHPAYQDLGFGRKTVCYVEKHLKKAGIEAIRLDAFMCNPAAVHLYEGLGYTMVGKLPFRKGDFGLYEKVLTF